MATSQTRADRLVAACAAAIDRVAAQEAASIDPDPFQNLGEALFWLVALADERRRKRDPLILGLTWARDRITHGVLVSAPASWHYGSEPGKLIPGLAVLGTISQHLWQARASVALGSRDRADPAKEAAYDQHVSGQPVIATLRAALVAIR